MGKFWRNFGESQVRHHKGIKQDVYPADVVLQEKLTFIYLKWHKLHLTVPLSLNLTPLDDINVIILHCICNLFDIQ